MTTDEMRQLASEYWAVGVRWKIYPNPMRSDGVVLAEDKPIEPYPGVHGWDEVPLYPATPQTTHRIPFQLPLAEAERVLVLLNSEERPAISNARLSAPDAESLPRTAAGDMGQVLEHLQDEEDEG